MQPRSLPITPVDDSFGASNPTGVSVGVASGRVLEAKNRRKSVVFVNDSAAVIYLAKRNPAILNAGIRLNANGGAYWEPDTVGNVWKGDWFAIAAGAASNLCITEDW